MATANTTEIITEKKNTSTYSTKPHETIQCYLVEDNKHLQILEPGKYTDKEGVEREGTAFKLKNSLEGTTTLLWPREGNGDEIKYSSKKSFGLLYVWIQNQKTHLGELTIEDQIQPLVEQAKNNRPKGWGDNEDTV